MQTTFTFRHHVKTSRRFVFENIMDLDHVCTLHKRWFRNLRIVAQKPDYVEYRLTSLFYGLKQEIRVRGAPIDENRYWYEFIAPLAKMRVDGLMEGPDGDLTQIETITFRFLWFLAPFFWLLRPFFKKQKEDILRDDSALLERVYELDRTGFKRLEPNLPRVVVYGGDGFFGRLVVEDLLKYSSAEIIVASRHPNAGTFQPFETRVHKIESDINDYASALSTIEGAGVVVNCIGPFQGQTLNLLRACIEKHVAYVDVADDRDFVVRCHQLSSLVTEAGDQSIRRMFSGTRNVFFADSVLPSGNPFYRTDQDFHQPWHGTFHGAEDLSSACFLLSEVNSWCPDGTGEKKVRGWTRRERVCFFRLWDIGGSISSSISPIIFSSHSILASRLRSSRSAPNSMS